MTSFQKFLIAATIAAVAPASATAQEAANDAALGAVMMQLDGSPDLEDISAATGWHVCDVIRTGAGWGNHYVALTCPTGPFVNKWHIMRADQMDAQLATALAAATADEQVQVNIGDLVVNGYNEIRALYLHK